MNAETYIDYDLPLDRNHRLYRVCMNKNHLKFKAKHANCKFSCPKCHNEFHNQSKKDETSKMELAVQPNHSQVETVPKLEVKIDVYNRAIELFSKLEIDPLNGSRYNLSDLLQVGFNPLSCYLQKLPG